MYITSKHICFYAYLPKKAVGRLSLMSSEHRANSPQHEAAKSGYLSKSGKRNPKYNRYWFRLKGDVLTYYANSTDFYFPHGQIDLRYGISATIVDKDKEGLHFQVETHHRTYHFRADSAPSAKEWVKSLQRVIFRSHNDGDSVKISLPIKNVIDIEDTQMIEFADTCKIRIIDNDETYAIDEVRDDGGLVALVANCCSTSSPSSALARKPSMCSEFLLRMHPRQQIAPRIRSCPAVTRGKLRSLPLREHPWQRTRTVCMLINYGPPSCQTQSRRPCHHCHLVLRVNSVHAQVSMRLDLALMHSNNLGGRVSTLAALQSETSAPERVLTEHDGR